MNMYGRHCRWSDLKSHSQFLPSFLPVMRGSWHSPGQQDGSLLGGIPRKAFIFLTKKGTQSTHLSLPVCPFPISSCPIHECDAWSAAAGLQSWSSKNEGKPLTYDWWTRVTDDGPGLGPWWQVHLQILCCARKVRPMCLWPSNWCSATCSWILF